MADMNDLMLALMLLREVTEDIDHDERQNPKTMYMEKTCPDCLLCRIEAYLSVVTDG